MSNLILNSYISDKKRDMCIDYALTSFFYFLIKNVSV